MIECGGMVAAAYASKLLADLGAEVIKIEPLTGDPARQRGPFPGGRAHPERSGLFLYLNANKRGIAVDLFTDAGHDLLLAMVRRSDLLIHNFPPAEMDRVGLLYEDLARIQPHLVMTSIAPFGLSGPRRNDAATDLTLWSAGGIAYLNGGGPEAADLPPLKPFGQQAEFQGGLNAAVASLAALFARAHGAGGQHVSVSIQESLVAILELTFEYWPYMGLVASRLGRKPIQPLDFFECRDGWVFVCCVEEHQWQAFIELMDHPQWAEMELFADRLSRARNWDALKLFIQEWVAERSVQELYRAGQARRIPLAPVSTMGDLFASEHLRARGYFAVLDHPETGPLQYPGAPYKLRATPWELRRPAPTLGQHNTEVLGEIGVSSERQAELRRARVI